MIQLFPGGQLTDEQEIGNLHKGTVFCKGFDFITTVVENSFFSVKKCNLGAAGSSVHVTGVKGDVSA